MKVTDKNFTNPADVLKTKGAEKKGVEKTSVEKKDSGSASKSEQLESAKVKLSERAGDMKKIKEKVDATPDVDDAKVAKIKSMLAKGEYKVDAKAVADKMVDEHLKNEFYASNYKDE